MGEGKGAAQEWAAHTSEFSRLCIVYSRGATISTTCSRKTNAVPANWVSGIVSTCEDSGCTGLQGRGMFFDCDGHEDIRTPIRALNVAIQ